MLDNPPNFVKMLEIVKFTITNITFEIRVTSQFKAHIYSCSLSTRIYCLANLGVALLLDSQHSS
jgi:hypothetical protein